MPTFDNSFLFNHTCLRIKDPKVSIPFYEKNFGFKHLRTFPVSKEGYTLYELGIEGEGKKGVNWAAREGILELRHKPGSENDDSFEINNGNSKEFRGFGHICLSVDNIQASESHLLDDGVKFQKKLSDGRQKNIAFALDPDGYWIELIEHGKDRVEGKTELSSYKLNHTMIRVKDPVKSLDFYRNVLGFKLFSKKEFESAEFTLYFLGFDHSKDFKEGELAWDTQAGRESILELTHNWGTESDNSFEGYHNGNDTASGAKQGFGHICVSCKDPLTFCQQIEKEYGDKVKWSVKYNQGPVPDNAFIQDPDGYLIEIFGSNMLSE